ncbi:MAG: hypothetical protein M3Y28_07115 [Armatimonadota bacterium]|nr:hypothetical protein [Armatimonadota bacterium]
MLAIVLLLAALLPLIFLGLMWLCANSIAYIQFRKTATQLSRSGRTLRRREALRKTSGTLIIEATSLGFPWSRAWWTEEDVSSAYSASLPTEVEAPSAFNQWVCENYMTDENGRACLILVWKGNEFQNALRTKAPSVKRVDVCSAHLMEIYYMDDTVTG